MHVLTLSGGVIGRAHVLGCLQQARGHCWQEVPHLLGVGFESGKLMLPVLQAATDRSPDVLKFGVGDTSQCQQSGTGGLVDVEGTQDALHIDHAWQQPAGLDPADLGLRHMAAPGQAFTGQARRSPEISQGCGQALPVTACLLWIESHPDSLAYSSKG